MKLLLSVSLLHLNLTIQRRSALTSRTTHHPFSNILTLIALHACRVFTNIVKREGGPPAFEGRYKYISFARFIDDGKRELERPTTSSARSSAYHFFATQKNSKLHCASSPPKKLRFLGTPIISVVPLPICRWQTGMIGFATH